MLITCDTYPRWHRFFEPHLTLEPANLTIERDPWTPPRSTYSLQHSPSSTGYRDCFSATRPSYWTVELFGRCVRVLSDEIEGMWCEILSKLVIEEELHLCTVAVHAISQTRKKLTRVANLSLNLRKGRLVTDHLLRGVACAGEVLLPPCHARIALGCLTDKSLLSSFFRTCYTSPLTKRSS